MWSGNREEGRSRVCRAAAEVLVSMISEQGNGPMARLFSQFDFSTPNSKVFKVFIKCVPTARSSVIISFAAPFWRTASQGKWGKSPELGSAVLFRCIFVKGLDAKVQLAEKETFSGSAQDKKTIQIVEIDKGHAKKLLYIKWIYFPEKLTMRCHKNEKGLWAQNDHDERSGMCVFFGYVQKHSEKERQF